MSPRSIFKNLSGAAFIAFCFYFVGGHMRYLSNSARPSREAISKELDEVVAAFPGERSSSVEIFDEKSLYVSARARMETAGGVIATNKDSQRHMEAHGWRKAQVAYGDIDRYCKGDLVAEVTPLEPIGSYTLQVVWGNADAVCKFK